VCASELGRTGRVRSMRGRDDALRMRSAIGPREGGLRGLSVWVEKRGTGGLQVQGLRFGVLGDWALLLMGT